MSIRDLVSDAKIVPLLSPLAAEAATARTSNVIDTKGYDAFTVLVHFGTIDGSADAQSIKLSHADAASDGTTLTSGADVLGSSQAVASDADDDLFYINVTDPTKRFYQLTVTKDTTNALNESAVAILYRNKESVPVTHATGSGTSGGSGAVTGESFVHPTSGTA